MVKAKATAGSAEAQFALGAMFKYDEPKNLEESAKWYRLAMDQGYPLAKQGLDDIKTVVLNR
jgi:TPR repeat protein